MADGSIKHVIKDVLKLWGRGPNVIPLFTDLTGDMPNGDVIDIPSIADVTVNSSESASVASTSLNTIEQLTKNITLFINQGMTQVQRAQLLNGNFPSELMAAIVGGAKDDLDRALLNYLLVSGAGSVLADTYHRNLAADAITPMDIYGLLGSARGQRGVNTSGWAFIGNPLFTAYAQGISGWQPVPVGPTGDLGLSQIANLVGIPYYEHSAVPGETLAMRQQAATTGAVIASNVATYTVAAGHGFVPGQQIWTSGLTVNTAVTSPATITSVTATTIVAPLTGSDGAMADGVGTVYSASSMAMLVYKPWAFFAQDRTMPTPTEVKREANAGWTLQMHMLYGRYARSGSVWVLHAPDSA